jgi:type VI secretion system protein ImpJ
MPPPAVHWYEGMFLRPHHFQAAEEHWRHQAALSGKWDNHFNWGLHAIDIDFDALADNSLVIRSLQGRTRRGTLVSVPADSDLPALRLQTALQRSSAVNVFLCVAELQSQRPNVPAGDEAGDVRYRLDRAEIEDQNRTGNRQIIDIRRLNLKLVLDASESPPDLAGYEAIRIARIEKSARVNAVPQLDPAYIPPLLACDAWKVLAEEILQSIYHRIGKKIEMLVTLVKTRRIGFESQAQGEAKLFHQLRMLNEAYALLGIMAFVKGIHPLTAYLELCRLVGLLAILGPERRPPLLPPYDHDDLGGCFHKIKVYLDQLLEAVELPRYEAEPFVVVETQLQAAIQPKWLEEAWSLHIGVVSSLPPATCAGLLRGGLDMKVGSADRVARIFETGEAALVFRHMPQPPTVLPSGPDVVYFQVERTPQTEPVWLEVLRSGKLAVQLNKMSMTGNKNGEHVLKITSSGGAHRLEFTLYAVPPDREPPRPPAAPERRTS